MYQAFRTITRIGTHFAALALSGRRGFSTQPSPTSLCLDVTLVKRLGLDVKIPKCR